MRARGDAGRAPHASKVHHRGHLCQVNVRDDRTSIHSHDDPRKIASSRKNTGENPKKPKTQPTSNNGAICCWLARSRMNSSETQPVENADGALDGLGGIRGGVSARVVRHVPGDGLASGLGLQQSEDWTICFVVGGGNGGNFVWAVGWVGEWGRGRLVHPTSGEDAQAHAQEIAACKRGCGGLEVLSIYRATPRPRGPHPSVTFRRHLRLGLLHLSLPVSLRVWPPPPARLERLPTPRTVSFRREKIAAHKKK